MLIFRSFFNLFKVTLIYQRVLHPQIDEKAFDKSLLPE